MYIHKIEQTNDNRVFQEGACEFLARELFDEFNYSTVFVVNFANPLHCVPDDRFLAMTPDEFNDFDAWFQDRMNFDGDYAGPYASLCHCFGKTERDGKTYYIDSTGITDDINDILSNFGYDMEYLEELAKDTELQDSVKVIEMKDPYNNINSHWSTNVDAWCSDDELDAWNIERWRLSKKFIEKHRDELDIDKALSKTKTKHQDRER